MAIEESLITISVPAGADLSAKQFTFVKVNSSGQAVAAATAGEYVLGILQNKPSAAGRIASVGILGVSKVVLDETVTPDDKIMTSADGQAAVGAAAAAPGNFITGQALIGGAAGEIGSVILGPSGYLTS